MTAYYNDIDPFCCEVLRKHIAAGDIPPGDVDERDIKTVDAEELKGYDQIHLFAGIGGFAYGLRLAGWPDDKPILTGGPPCQPVSIAGRRLGADDERWMWPEFFRILRVLRWREYVIAENPPGIFNRGFGYVLRALAESGFDAAWSIVSAEDVGAPHLRERVWVVAHSGGEGLERGIEPRILNTNDVASSFQDARLSESDAIRTRHGIPNYVDRIRSLGNAVVPQCVAVVARMVLESEMVA